MGRVKCEIIHDNTACSAEDCQLVYTNYMTLYEKYTEAVEANHVLVGENKVLENHIQCRMEIMEAELRVTKNQLSEANLVSDGLLGKLESVKSTEWAPTCPGCEKNRTALVNQRSAMASNYLKSESSVKELNARLDRLLADYRAVDLENGKLRVAASQTKHPFHEHRVIEGLKTELQSQKTLIHNTKVDIENTRKERDLFYYKWKTAKERVDNMEEKMDEALCKIELLERAGPTVLSGLVEDENRNLKRKFEDLEPKERDDSVCVTINDVLSEKLIDVFQITDRIGCEIEENILYDKFMESIPSVQYEQYLSAMYLACHTGEDRLPLRERKMIHDEIERKKVQGVEKGPRVCKSSFAVCLRAIGGVCNKKGTQNLWVNVKPR